MSDFDAFKRMRRPLPQWWWSYSRGEAVTWPDHGIGFEAHRGEGSGGCVYRCFVSRRTLERISRELLSTKRMLRCWQEHGARFEVAARRKIEAQFLPAAVVVTVELADLSWD